VAPLLTAGVNVKGPLAGTGKSEAPLFCSTTLVLAARPLTVPPIVTVPAGFVAQATATLVTFADAVPVPPVTVQVCPEGCVNTVTAYVAPLLIAGVNVNAPLALTVKFEPLLFCSTTLAPVARPVSDPPIVYVTVGVGCGAGLPPPPPPPQAATRPEQTTRMVNRKADNDFIGVDP
jgi:hypothetical protein